MHVLTANSAKGAAEQAHEVRRAAADTHALPRHWTLETPALDKTVELARQLARMPLTPILVQGEPGSGVPEIANLVHESDPVARPLGFRTVPGFSVTPTEMRGCRVEGTLLIEDIQSLRPEGQEWLRGTLARGGGVGERPVRIIAASNLSVPELLVQPQLSRELVHSLDVGRIVIPPLRERKTDIIFLARRFLRHYAQSLGRPALCFSREAEDKLAFHSYPANVCELRNIVERAVALSEADEIAAHFINFYDERESPSRAERLRVVPAMRGEQVCNLPSLAEVERDYLILLIRELRGRRSEISRVMGVSYPTVRRKIEAYGLDINAILEGP